MRAVKSGFRVRGSAFRVLVLAVLLSAPLPARADWVIAPFLSGQMGGDALHKNTAVGVSGGWKSNSWLGAEADFSWAPQFFEQNGFTTERQVTTLVGNVVVSIPWASATCFSRTCRAASG